MKTPASSDLSTSLASSLEHTCLTPGATSSAIKKLCDEAWTLKLGGVCVPGAWVPWTRTYLDHHCGERAMDLVSVAGFPWGYAHPDAITHEIMALFAAGADHVDVVAPWHLLADPLTATGDSFLKTLERYRHAAGKERTLKLILETAALTPDQIAKGSRWGMEAGFNYLKTSTGFHPKGGATLEAIQIMKAEAPGLLLKASGGIRTREQALEYLQEGVARLGTSQSLSILGKSTSGPSSY